MLHRFALLVAATTFLLVIAGASVTSTGSGLAVPDWPLSYGTLFPRMEGGVLYEHGHRMIAGVVLVLTGVLTIALFRCERRAWVRRLGLVALAALVAQAVLGGLTVLLKLPTAISVGHAALANVFFAMMVCLALATSPGWREGAREREAGGATSPRSLALLTTGAIYAQILLGAVVRHSGAGLVIPDFPLVFGGIFPQARSAPVMIHYAHRLGALAVTILVAVLALRIGRRRHGETALARPVLALSGGLVLQLLLGALVIWTRRSPVVTVLHVALGSAMFAASLVVTVRSWRLLAAPAASRRTPAPASPAAAVR